MLFSILLLQLAILFTQLAVWRNLKHQGAKIMASASELRATVNRVLTEVSETATVIQEQAQKIIDLLANQEMDVELRTAVDEAVGQLNQAADRLNALQPVTEPPPAPIEPPPPVEPV